MWVTHLLLFACMVLANTEGTNVLSELKSITSTQRRILQILERVVSVYEHISQVESGDVESDLVASYVMYNRLQADIQFLSKEVGLNTSFGVMEKMRSEISITEKIKDSASTLLHLQGIYMLLPEELAEGLVDGVRIHQLKGPDMYKLGKIAVSQNDKNNGLRWFHQAYIQKNSADYLDNDELMEYATLLKELGNKERALRVTSKPIQQGVEDEDLMDLWSELMVAKDTSDAESHPMASDGLPALKLQPVKPPHTPGELLTKDYEALCRGERTKATPRRSELTCSYRHRHPFHVLRPLRQEVLNENPWVFVYHDELTDSFIDRVIEISKPKLQPSKVQAAHNSLQKNRDRISDSLFLAPGFFQGEESILKGIKRIDKVAGLYDTAEQLQVLRYKVGGHYIPHLDALQSRIPLDSLKMGDRIATVLCYANDVKLGGATVFPRLGLTVWPEKGSCVMWYNLKRNGEADQLTLHAGCPVVAGRKWAMNRWIRERGQIFRRPCLLNQWQ